MPYAESCFLLEKIGFKIIGFKSNVNQGFFHCTKP